MVAFCKVLEKILATVCAILMTVMVLDVTWQVISRWILKNPSSVTEELARFIMIWIGFIGSAYAYKKYAHLGLDVLTSKLEGSRRRAAEWVAELLCIFFAGAIMVYGGFNVVALTLELNQISPALQVKMGYVYAIIPISGAFICVFALERMVFGRPQHDLSVSVD